MKLVVMPGAPSSAAFCWSAQELGDPIAAQRDRITRSVLSKEGAHRACGASLLKEQRTNSLRSRAIGSFACGHACQHDCTSIDRCLADRTLSLALWALPL